MVLALLRDISEVALLNYVVTVRRGVVKGGFDFGTVGSGA
jgi:hypothetical protein